MKHLHRCLLAAALPCAVLLAPACKSSGSIRADAKPILATAPVAGDPELPSSIQLLDPRLPMEVDRKVAYFALDLASGAELDVLFHVEWSDAAQRPIATLPQSWHAAHLVRGQPVPVRAPAPDPRAHSFRVLFQRPGAVH